MKVAVSLIGRVGSPELHHHNIPNGLKKSRIPLIQRESGFFFASASRVGCRFRCRTPVAAALSLVVLPHEFADIGITQLRIRLEHPLVKLRCVATQRGHGAKGLRHRLGDADVLGH